MTMLIEAAHRAETAAHQVLTLLDTGGVSCEQLRQMMTVTKRVIAAMTAAQTRAAAVIAKTERHGDGGTEILAETAGLTRREARGQVKTAQTIAEVPSVRDAVAQGRVSQANAKRLADAVKRTSADAVKADAELLKMAESQRAEQFTKHARRWIAEHQNDGGEADYQRLRAKRSLRIWNDDNGMVELHGTFDPLTGQRIGNRLRAEANRLYQNDKKHATTQHNNHRTDGEPSNKPADGPDGANSGRRDGRRSFDQCMADAMDNLTSTTATALNPHTATSPDTIPDRYPHQPTLNTAANTGTGTNSDNHTNTGHGVATGTNSASGSGTAIAGKPQHSSRGSTDTGAGTGTSTRVQGEGSEVATAPTCAGAGSATGTGTNTRTDSDTCTDSDSGTGTGSNADTATAGQPQHRSRCSTDMNTNTSADSDTNTATQPQHQSRGSTDKRADAGTSTCEPGGGSEFAAATSCADTDSATGKSTNTRTDSDTCTDSGTNSSAAGTGPNSQEQGKASQVAVGPHAHTDTSTGVGLSTESDTSTTTDTETATRTTRPGLANALGYPASTTTDTETANGTDTGTDTRAGPGLVRSFADICVVAHVDEATGELVGQLADGQRLPASVMEQLSCNARFVAVLCNSKGQSIWRAQTVRAATKSQRRLLLARWGGCFHCAANPAMCEIHHIVPVSQGGETKIDNMVPVCWDCHKRIHNNHWQVHKHPDGNHTLHPPDKHHHGPAHAPEQPLLFK